MNGEMVRATLKGIKTQTRRIVKPQFTYENGDLYDKILGPELYEPAAYGKDGEMVPGKEVFGIYTDDGEWGTACPFGQPGDRLWVRESCQGWTFDESGENVVRYPADGGFSQIENSTSGADKWVELYNYRGKRGAIVPSIHMPRWASRILLEIVNVRVERLQEISVSEAIAEGYDGSNPEPVDPAIKWYAELWESINGTGSWDANPWVWVIEFKMVPPCACRITNLDGICVECGKAFACPPA